MIPFQYAHVSIFHFPSNNASSFIYNLNSKYYAIEYHKKNEQNSLNINYAYPKRCNFHKKNFITNCYLNNNKNCIDKYIHINIYVYPKHKSLGVVYYVDMRAYLFYRINGKHAYIGVFAICIGFVNICIFSAPI